MSKSSVTDYFPQPLSPDWSETEWMWLARVQQTLPVRSELGFPLLAALFALLNRNPADWRLETFRFLRSNPNELDHLITEIGDLLDLSFVEHDCLQWCRAVAGLHRRTVQRMPAVPNCEALLIEIDALARRRRRRSAA